LKALKNQIQEEAKQLNALSRLLCSPIKKAGNWLDLSSVVLTVVSNALLSGDIGIKRVDPVITVILMFLMTVIINSSEWYLCKEAVNNVYEYEYENVKQAISEKIIDLDDDAEVSGYLAKFRNTLNQMELELTRLLEWAMTDRKACFYTYKVSTPLPYLVMSISSLLSFLSLGIFVMLLSFSEEDRGNKQAENVINYFFAPLVPGLALLGRRIITWPLRRTAVRIKHFTHKKALRQQEEKDRMATFTLQINEIQSIHEKIENKVASIKMMMETKVDDIDGGRKKYQRTLDQAKGLIRNLSSEGEGFDKTAEEELISELSIFINNIDTLVISVFCEGNPEAEKQYRGVLANLDKHISKLDEAISKVDDSITHEINVISEASLFSYPASESSLYDSGTEDMGEENTGMIPEFH